MDFDELAIIISLINNGTIYLSTSRNTGVMGKDYHYSINQCECHAEWIYEIV